MLTRFNIFVLSFGLLSIGCQGLTPGQMEWVQTQSDKPRAGNVYLVRGLIGVFSTGMDTLAGQLNGAGVRARVFQDSQESRLAEQMVKAYRDAKDPEPLVLIGHSYGADDVLRIAQTLQDRNIPVDMVITVDATTPPSVPPNVRVCYNYYQSQLTDVIPMFRGIALRQEKPGVGSLVNMDLRKDRTDLLEGGTNHINIDKNQRVHKAIVDQVLAACPPREQWAASRRTSPAAQQASEVTSPPVAPANSSQNSSSPQVRRTESVGTAN